MARKSKKVPVVEIDYESLSDEQKVKYNQYISEFNGKTLYQLRDDARKLFVESATTYGKVNLIKVMLNKLLFETVSDNNNETQIKDIQSKLMSDFRNSASIEGEKICGYFVSAPLGGELLTEDIARSNIIVPQGLVNEFGLTDGDYIVAKTRQIGATRGVFDIFEIGGRKQLRDKPTMFDDLLAVRREEKITLKGNSVTKGGRIILPPVQIFDIMDIVGQLTEQKIRPIAVFLDELPENIEDIKIRAKNLYYYATCDADADYQTKTALAALNIAKRYAQSGEDVALIARNSDAIVCEYAKTVLGSGRAFRKGSLTVIVTDDRFAKFATDIIK